MPQHAQVSTLILAFLSFLVIFVNVSQIAMSHADTGQQQGDFRQTEGKCEGEDGKKTWPRWQREQCAEFLPS